MTSLKNLLMIVSIFLLYSLISGDLIFWNPHHINPYIDIDNRYTGSDEGGSRALQDGLLYQDETQYNPHQTESNPYVDSTGVSYATSHHPSTSTHVPASLHSPSTIKEKLIPTGTNPLMPYYFMVASRYPYSKETEDKPLPMNIRLQIKRAIDQSQFQIWLEDIQIKKALANQLQGEHESILLEDFLIRLCLQNIVFLISIRKEVDDPVGDETTKILNWLHHHYINDLHLANAVKEHLQTKYTRKSFPSRKIKNSKYDYKVSGIKAKEGEIILHVLGSYYKSKNLKKWKALFPKDVSFLKYHLRITVMYLNHKYVSDFPEHWLNFNGNGFLPWEDESCKKPDLTRTTFNNIRGAYTMISSHMQQANIEAWEEEIKDEF